MKLLRTIQLDASDSCVFEKPAEAREWGVSGAFAFVRSDPANLRGKARTAFRAGFLACRRCRSTLAQIVEASEEDRMSVVEMLAVQLLNEFGAPDLSTARLAAEEVIEFITSLCIIRREYSLP